MLPIRTAVLVVHGMGLQRPLDTVRGVIKAVWQSGDPSESAHKIWLHPERSGIDIDLAVITTSWLDGVTPNRSVDFHELYWSHLMSETPGLAVLLWLFELAHKGPSWLKPNMRLVWGAGALFLVLMILSISLLVLKVIERLAGVSGNPESLLITPVLMFLIFAIVCILVFAWFRAWAFILWSIAAAVLLAGAYWFSSGQSANFVTLALPALIALIAVRLLMGNWGVVVFFVAYVFSFFFELLIHWKLDPTIALSDPQLIPWAMTSPWCLVAACVILATYQILSMVFLQPYLGDAARYFRDAPSNVAVRREIRRQAVDTLEGLHLSGRYDRIVVVAHSLGTVIAYDMLRAYFARVARSLPTTGYRLEQRINEAETKIDAFTKSVARFQKAMAESKKKRGTAQPASPDPSDLRSHGRQIIRDIAFIVNEERNAAHEKTAGNAPDVGIPDSAVDTEHKAWLVTDFVTLGSPLAHAHYLMCDGQRPDELVSDFKRRVKEREFPVCPPKREIEDGDGPLTYRRAGDSSGRCSFHNGALFGLTRWTNLFFPVSELFHGDAIGGPLGDIFGFGIVDIGLAADSPRDSGLRAHTRYWYMPKKDPLKTPHIQELRNAINLTDA